MAHPLAFLYVTISDMVLQLTWSKLILFNKLLKFKYFALN